MELNKWNLTGSKSIGRSYDTQISIPTASGTFGKKFIFSALPPDITYNLQAAAVSSAMKEQIETGMRNIAPVFIVKTSDGQTITGRPDRANFEQIEGAGQIYKCSLDLTGIENEDSGNMKNIFDFSNYSD